MQVAQDMRKASAHVSETDAQTQQAFVDKNLDAGSGMNLY